MDEVIKQKIQEAYFEPRAPETLIEKVVVRTQAVAMGVEARKQLETAPAEKVGELASCALVGQLASVTELPTGAQPEELARLLEQEPAFQAALRGGNVAQRVNSGELMRQVAGQAPEASPLTLELSAPKKGGPSL